VHRVHARDVSQGGVKIDSSAPLLVGAEVVVSLAGLEPLPGVVRWQDGGSFGITYNKIMPLSVLVAWIQGQRERIRAVG
jgi:hypothetical protein